jgi:uncharacterized protein (DUF362 family)
VEKSTVAIVKGERGHEPVFRALDLIDYKSCLAGYERVLIKVNFIAVKTWDTGATTDPIVVEAIIKKLAHLPIEVKVVESDATMTNANRAYDETGMKEMCECNGVEFCKFALRQRHRENSHSKWNNPQLYNCTSNSQRIRYHKRCQTQNAYCNKSYPGYEKHVWAAS